jgi:hypothetical protein
MFAIQKKSIRSGETEIMSYPQLTSTTLDAAIKEFTEIVREWLDNDSLAFYCGEESEGKPDGWDGPGWYNDSEQLILLDGEIIDYYDDGHHIYAIIADKGEKDEKGQ